MRYRARKIACCAGPFSRMYMRESARLQEQPCAASVGVLGSGDISSFYRAAQRVSRPNRPFPRSADRVNGKTADLVEIFFPLSDAPGRS